MAFSSVLFLCKLHPGAIPIRKKAFNISRVTECSLCSSTGGLCCLRWNLPFTPCSLIGFHFGSVISAGTGHTLRLSWHQTEWQDVFWKSLVKNTHMNHVYIQTVTSVIVLRVVSRPYISDECICSQCMQVLWWHTVAFSYIKLFQISRFLCTAPSYILCKQTGNQRTVRSRQASIG